MNLSERGSFGWKAARFIRVTHTQARQLIRLLSRHCPMSCPYTAGPHTGLDCSTMKSGIAEGQNTKAVEVEDTLQTISAAVNPHPCRRSVSSKSGYRRSQPTEYLFKKKKKKFVLQFQILLSLYDIIQWLNTVMKCKCHFMKDLCSWLCPGGKKKDSSILQSLRYFKHDIYTYIFKHHGYYSSSPESWVLVLHMP